MATPEHVDADMGYFAALDVGDLVEELKKADEVNDERLLQMISGELGRRIAQLSEIKASCDDSINTLQMKDFG